MGRGIRVMEGISGGLGTYHGAVGIGVGYWGILKALLGTSLLGGGPQGVGEMGDQELCPCPSFHIGVEWWG